MSATGLIFDVQRFATHDGPGIRTVVFLKGCPLRCRWCHNPESIADRRELFFEPTLCVGCGRCVAACGRGGHLLSGGRHVYDRDGCRVCLKCADACPAGALEAVGREASVDEVFALVERDRVFYEQSGGGLTLSGGEPARQAEFCVELLAEARARSIHTCVETCGVGPEGVFAALAAAADLFLWDIKDSDAKRHLESTGGALETIYDNLSRVDARGSPTVLRCVLLRGLNLDERHLNAVADLFGRLRHCRGVELIAYHPFGRSKAAKLARQSADRPNWQPGEAAMAQARATLTARGVPVVE